MSVKQLEKKVEGLTAKRLKQHDALAATEGELGAALSDLATARKSEGPPRIATNKAKPKAPQGGSADVGSD